MQRKKMPIIFYVIIALAVIGLMTNPTHLVRNIFMMLGVGVVIFALFYFIFRKPRPTENDEMKKYKQALKQSKRKYQTTQRQQARPTKSKQSGLHIYASLKAINLNVKTVLHTKRS